MEFNPYPDPFMYPPQTERGPEVELGGRPKSTSAAMPAEPAGQQKSQSVPEPDFSELEPADLATEKVPTRSFAGAIGFFVIIVLIIGGWYYFSSRGAPEKSPPLKPPGPGTAKTPDSQPNLIAASLGGTIKNGEASIIIPPFALTSDMEIFIKRVAEGAAESATDLYYLEPHGYKFLKPVTVIIPYKKYPSRLKYTQNGSTKYTPFIIDESSTTVRIEVMEF